jgi:hypothetical protein
MARRDVSAITGVHLLNHWRTRDREDLPNNRQRMNRLHEQREILTVFTRRVPQVPRFWAPGMENIP